MKVINLTRLTQSVGVRHTDGRLDSVNVVPRGKINLREGMEVDIRWEQLNPGVIKIIADQKPIQAMITIPQTGIIVSGEESKPVAPQGNAAPKLETQEG